MLKLLGITSQSRESDTIMHVTLNTLNDEVHKNE